MSDLYNWSFTNLLNISKLHRDLHTVRNDTFLNSTTILQTLNQTWKELF